jgi:hypothetical protein
MRKIKLFVYDHAPPHIHDSILGYENTTPFSKKGIERWCEIVKSHEAELFYCGQYADKDRWMLNPNRFDYFVGNEPRHVFDLEGDDSHNSFLPWMRPCIITAMNAEPNRRNWNCLVRPGCSNLLLDLVKNPPKREPPPESGFFFMGQRDPNGLREKVERAFRESKLPGEFAWTDKWNAPSSLVDIDVKNYVEGMKSWSFQLCPAGSGQMTLRFFEACAFGRLPIVIADNLLFDDPCAFFAAQYPTESSVESLKRRLQLAYECKESYSYDLLGKVPEVFFAKNVTGYFEDPTLWFLNKAQLRGYLPGREFIEQYDKNRED